MKALSSLKCEKNENETKNVMQKVFDLGKNLNYISSWCTRILTRRVPRKAYSNYNDTFHRLIWVSIHNKNKQMHFLFCPYLCNYRNMQNISWRASIYTSKNSLISPKQVWRFHLYTHNIIPLRLPKSLHTDISMRNWAFLLQQYFEVMYVSSNFYLYQTHKN